jgi:hypothetical protein
MYTYTLPASRCMLCSACGQTMHVACASCACMSASKVMPEVFNAAKHHNATNPTQLVQPTCSKHGSVNFTTKMAAHHYTASGWFTKTIFSITSFRLTLRQVAICLRPPTNSMKFRRACRHKFAKCITIYCRC